MIQKTFCVVLAKIILHISFCGTQHESIGLHLPKSDWIGLGFYLSKYHEKKEPNFYNYCFEDSNFFMQANYHKLNGKLFTANRWLKNGNLELVNKRNQKIYCKVDSEGYFPELIFYKDLLDIRKKFTEKIVWTRKHFMYSHNAKGSVVKYDLPKFTALKITAVDLAPSSQEVSVRLSLETDTGYPGFLDVNYTAINRKPPYNGLERYLYLKNPKKLFKIIDTNWDLIKKSKTSLGMNIREVLMSRGNPINKFKEGSETVLVYPSKNLINEYLIFFEDHLVEIKPVSGDGF